MTLKTENEFITALIRKQITVKEIFDSNFDTRSLKYNADIYDWVINYYQENDKLPDMDLLSTRFPVFMEVEVSNSPKEILTALKRGFEVDLFQRDLHGAVNIIQKTGNVKQAKAFLENQLMLYDNDETKDVFDLIGEGEELLTYYEERQKAANQNSGVGIPTGFGLELDVWLNGGLQKGNLYGILGPLGIGKSWSFMIIGGSAIRSNKTPFYLALEGTKEKEGYRGLTTLTGISNTGLHGAALEKDDVVKAIRKLKTDFPEQKFWIAVHGSREFYTPTILYQKIIKYKPDLVLVDYPSLMSTGNNNAAGWEEEAIISRRLKTMATSFNIPIVAILQGNRGSAQKEELEATDSSYYGPMRDFDAVLGITKVKGMEFTIQINDIKGRDAYGRFKAYYQTNWDKGKIKFLEHVTENAQF